VLPSAGQKVIGDGLVPPVGVAEVLFEHYCGNHIVAGGGGQLHRGTDSAVAGCEDARQIGAPIG